MSRFCFVAATLAGATALLSAAPAAAEVSAAAFVGTGVTGDPGDDLMGIGSGARVGYSMLIPFYVGIAASLHQGTKDDEPDVPFNSMSYYGAEFGFDFELASFGLRPYLTAGVADVTTTRDVSGGFVSPYFGAGIAPYYNVIDTVAFDLFVGLDVRYVQTTTSIDNGDNTSPAVGVPLYLHVGVGFL